MGERHYRLYMVKPGQLLAGKRPVMPEYGRLAGPVLHLRLFSDLQRIIDLNAEITHGALQLGMP
jgi:hypothetical protein